ncbi:N-acetylmuramoyl-L-alanine amidase [Aureimonas frigidaquae]|uniref:N-acetylmuramoyl-L-alanine amidase n=1 Tax=Aureimonas frigidaquae TaxID=424757 RepID=A0A0P0Z2N1_9HYPH|nr:N-acetylmuramoyl-L-alanine amidase [Aureimonas frigidaquae]BAT28338.1 N-acetylmuramoyl-L-alanine amidase [Aureimonas frigidaquae]
MTNFWSRILFLLAALMWFQPGAGATTVITSVHYSAHAQAANLSIGVTEDVAVTMRLLDGPPRIVLDFPDTVLATPFPPVEGGAVVRNVRDGLAGEGRYRIVFETAPDVLAGVERVEAPDGRRILNFELRPVDPSAYAEAMRADAAARSQDRVLEAPQRSRQAWRVVIDPGHGGIDNGATGVTGVHEKDINLAFARALQAALATQGDVDPVLTRDADIFVPLARRVQIASDQGADLFVSIHADSIAYDTIRGATVYTLSDVASDKLAGEVADSENAADRFAGPEWQNDTPEIHGILVDLMRRENEAFSTAFAGMLVDDLKAGGIGLINNPHRSAGFRVLRAPDVPSVLFELGYLSNVKDETLVQSGEWQGKVADLAARAILRFLEGRGPAWGVGKPD